MALAISPQRHEDHPVSLSVASWDLIDGILRFATAVEQDSAGIFNLVHHGSVAELQTAAFQSNIPKNKVVMLLQTT